MFVVLLCCDVMYSTIKVLVEIAKIAVVKK